MKNLAVLILAAGKGERMKSDLPKVLHPLCGRPMLSYSLEVAKQLKPSKTAVITGHQSQKVRDSFPKEKVQWVLQKEQLGTAHAVLCGLSALKGFSGELFILYGDIPLLRAETLQGMQKTLQEQQASLVLLTMQMANPHGYGRIVRHRNGDIERIVEEKEASEEQKKIQEVNSGIYLIRMEDLTGPLEKVKKSIVKGEYYLTDLIEELLKEGKKVIAQPVIDATEVMGINNRRELSVADSVLQKRIRDEWMMAGVTMLFPETIRIDREVRLEPDVVLHPGVVVTGSSKVGRGAEVLPYSMIEESVIGKGAKIGPFAHIRPGSEVESEAHVGNFVELKKTKLGKGAKANHLAYLGDAVIGARANVGAGTITCNYDGFKKHLTEIGEEAFIGSDTQLVAPVKVGRRAWVGAGTTVTKDVPAGTLAVSRVDQKNIAGYDQRKRKMK